MSFFVGRIWSELLEAAILAMTSGDPVRATHTLDALEAAAGSYAGTPASPLSSAWEPFLSLLKRRGYFVGDLAETRGALEEIHEMGQGFDLYDLAAALSRCDTALAAHLNSPSARAFPELVAFTRPRTPS
ncbi:MAG: hypothetical protein EHM91_01930 [Planctomycetota bacterium]|nr:MAG: hypothetical protein EHM91_01930 [Planctomycetota bacterium]